MIIRNVNIPDFKSFEIQKSVDIFIKDGTIDKIMPSEPGFTEVPVAEHVIDGKGMTAIPGMVNTHAHTAMTLLRGTAEDLNALDWFNKRMWIYEQGLKPRDIYVGSMIGAAEMLLNGVTCVADHYFSMEQAWSAFHQVGIRADLSWALFGMGDEADANYSRSLEFIEDFQDKDPRIKISLGPHSPYLCPDDFLRKVVDAGEKLGLKLHIHVAEDERQMLLSKKERGKTPIEVLYDTGVIQDKGKGAGTILAHAYWASDSDMDIIAKCDAGIAHCPKTYARFGDFHDFLPRALSHGLSVGMGSDGPASNSNMNLMEAARLAALIAKGTAGRAEEANLSQVLPLLFGGGKILGLPEYGALLPGAPADIVLLNLSTPEMMPGTNFFADLLYCMDGRSVDTVVVDGKPLVMGGKLMTISLVSLKEEAEEIAVRLVSTKADAPMQTY
ncbi:MAG: amidohydrolase [Spirochaetales bacterium]|nr:amidohydrolase [Spirochaetales bacterium]